MRNCILFFFFIYCIGAKAQNYTLQDSLMGHWLFSQNMLDSSGNYFHAANFGATYTTDRFGIPNRALHFDGINDSVIVGNILDVSKQKAVSFSAWFKPETIIPTGNRHVGMAIGRKTQGEVAMGVDTESTKLFSARLYGGANQSVNSSSSYCRTTFMFNYNVWYHLVAVFSDYSVTFYIDGYLEDGNCSQNLGGGILNAVQPNAFLRFGKAFNSYETEKLLHGALDDIRVYNRALDYCEVLKLYGDSSLITVAPNDTAICAGESVLLTAKSGDHFLWSNGKAGKSITVSPLVPTRYYLQDSVRGCIDSVFVDVYPSPTALFTADVSAGMAPLTVHFTNLSVGANAYYWNFDDGSASTTQHASHTFLPGNYNVSLTVTNASGCTDVFYFPIIVHGDFSIIIPNTFSPNNDGNNDFWKVKINGYAQNITCQIYNRWGSLVFQKNSLPLSWDGKFKNKNVAAGVYFYLITFLDANQETKVYKGEIHLF